MHLTKTFQTVCKITRVNTFHDLDVPTYRETTLADNLLGNFLSLCSHLQA
jgi:hypothetical protein